MCFSCDVSFLLQTNKIEMLFYTKIDYKINKIENIDENYVI